jgi:Predicted peptidase
MKLQNIILLFFLPLAGYAQPTDTLTIKWSGSKYDSTFFKRVIKYDDVRNIYDVKDYYLSGQIASQGGYLLIDSEVKEEFWNYHSRHLKHGCFRKWYENGQLEWDGCFDSGLIQGSVTAWYINEQIHYTGEYSCGMQNGLFTYYHRDGKLYYVATFRNGDLIAQERARYDYLTYLPDDYNTEIDRKFPLIIFLHGGSSRGNDLKLVKANGIPDQIERGKKIPFIVAAPQCPIDKRWESDDWFDAFIAEIKNEYRIDTNRIYLTGFSLGGSGTWYLALQNRSMFAAIAPICGKTLHNQIITDSVCQLSGIQYGYHSKRG